MAKHGVCCICGTLGPLSFEHVPPQSAFNDKRVFLADIQKLIGGGREAFERPKGKYSQRGAGSYTLCEDCNSKTGGWYGGAYVDWARDGMRFLGTTTGAASLHLPFTTYPLRVLKQIVVMFFSACGPGFQSQHPDLVRFVLNKTQTGLPDHFRVYAFYCDLGNSLATRQAGVTGLLKGSQNYVFAEIAFPPFGLVLSIKSPPPDPRLADISVFSKYGYNEVSRLYVKLPLLPVSSYFPADYRTGDQVRQALVP